MRESVAWSKSVRVTELKVPSTAIFGESVTLICSYDLGSEELYVVKWYKDDLEFYRYEPKDDNQSVYFPQPGIDIDWQLGTLTSRLIERATWALLLPFPEISTSYVKCSPKK
ncbi:hypothetical protein CDAR_174551 [Caerostris darwini]|uniref:Ig-like domain-containing protein n=1 Tax=Caerostris darwini TaxID=1538125 RepID=A0AAV4MQI4_9ARAC|nr:hypothetical protein CDAR_174551 [Caerostris darwini]